jgi:hypothetical protein
MGFGELFEAIVLVFVAGVLIVIFYVIFYTLALQKKGLWGQSRAITSQEEAINNQKIAMVMMEEEQKVRHEILELSRRSVANQEVLIELQREANSLLKRLTGSS